MRSVLIFGRRRQGKSTLALSLALTLPRRPIILYDPCSQYIRYPANDASQERIDDMMEFAEVIRIVPDDVWDDFETLMEVMDGGVWYWSEYTLIIDEASMLQKPQSAHPALLRLIRQAPDDITVIQTLHRPSESHPTMRALATDIFFFQTYLARDLAVMRDTWGDEVATIVSRLGRHEVLHFWLAEGGQPQYEVWDKPHLWYVPIQREYIEYVES